MILRNTLLSRSLVLRGLWVVLAGGVLALGPAPAAGSNSSRHAGLTRVAYTVAPDRTRLVFDLSASARCEIRSYPNPDRIAVDLRGVDASSDVRETEIADGVVRRVRVNRLSWGTQIVFDLRKPAGWSEYYLQPVDGMPDRVVIDVSESPASKRPGKTGGAGTETVAETPVEKSVVTEKRTDRAPGNDNEDRIFVVAIDAGHGGKAVGTTKNNLVEKELALDISRRLARKIDETKGFKAVLTRDSDVYLDLVDRTRIAKRKGADIFVSVHLNSAPRKTARGIEVWFISPAGAEATAKKILSNREAAARELGLDEPENSDIMHMLVDVNQQAMMQRSFLLAEEILDATNRPGLPPARSVKQQSFAVLKSIDMPSVLVEGGFLTNSKDAAFIKVAKGRQALADAVAAGIVSYMKKYPPPPAEKEKRDTIVHRVQPGETLWAISKKYNTTVASIRSSNRLNESDVLFVGQELLIGESHDGH